MAQPQITQADLQLIRKEIEAQGEFFNQEKLERVAELDRVRIELETIRVVLGKLLPEFKEEYKKAESRLLKEFNPEARAG